MYRKPRPNVSETPMIKPLNSSPEAGCTAMFYINDIQRPSTPSQKYLVRAEIPQPHRTTPLPNPTPDAPPAPPLRVHPHIPTHPGPRWGVRRSTFRNMLYPRIPPQTTQLNSTHLSKIEFETYGPRLFQFHFRHHGIYTRPHATIELKLKILFREHETT
ncbi:hypothetical protein B0H13DRAFT_1865026 [Mycena leptocephala]|nr:hypothetical protein B0H13DRAFT_1865026 [Mycena leptocephala]